MVIVEGAISVRGGGGGLGFGLLLRVRWYLGFEVIGPNIISIVFYTPKPYNTVLRVLIISIVLYTPKPFSNYQSRTCSGG